MNIPTNPPYKYPTNLFLISPIGLQTVGKQMKLDLVIMVRPALNMASMILSFLYKYEENF